MGELAGAPFRSEPTPAPRLPGPDRQETSSLPKLLEAPFVGIVRNIVHEKIPEHTKSFDTTLDEINKQVMGEGLYIYNSQKQPGVSFLAGHLSVTPELINRIAAAHNLEVGGVTPFPEPKNPSGDTREQKIDHYVYVIQPAFGLGRDGSALSALDMGIARFIHEMPVVAAAIRDGRPAPSVDIHLGGGLTSLGGKATRKLVDRVKGTNGHASEGFEPYAEVYAEFIQDCLKRHGIDASALPTTKIVLQGASKGALTSDLTTHHLPEEIKARTVRLYDNPAGNQERKLGTQVRRALRMGYGMVKEALRRERAKDIPAAAFKTQGDFYDAFAKERHLEDSPEQAKLKGELFFRLRDFLSFHRGGEVRTLAHGTPLDEEQRTFIRVSTPDPVNPDFELKKRVEEIRSRGENVLGLRRIFVGKRQGNISTFATANVFHNYPWERSIVSGSWAQKMEFVENTHPPQQQAA